jgi:Polysaccharide lyase 14
MTLRSFNSRAWSGTLAIGTSVAVASFTGCDMSYTPLNLEFGPSSSGSGGGSGAGSSSGSGGSSSGPAGSSSSGGSPSASSSGSGSSGSSSSGGSTSGSSSGGGSSSGSASGGTPPTTLYCPAGKTLGYYLNFTDPNWEQNVNFTFGIGKQMGWAMNGQTDNNISVVQDPTKGQVLKVLYRGGSGPNSCFTCIPDEAVQPSCTCTTSGGAEFYADFAQGKILESAFLSYWARFGDTGMPFDFGKAGKMPGMSGGIPVSGLNTTDGSGFSSREMWRPGICNGKNGELYWYGLPAGSANIDDCGVGPAWSWPSPSDEKWHQVQMQVDMNTAANTDARIRIWYDQPPTGTPNIDRQGIGLIDRTKFPMNSVNQLMFSTFFGGHDNTWGPGNDVYAYFADFQICW